jgi:hypothetical protein
MNNNYIEKLAKNLGLGCKKWDDNTLFVRSEGSYGPRGDYYHYLLFRDGKLYAIGNEQGNYAGGIYAYADQEAEGYSKEKYPFLSIDNQTIDELPSKLRQLCLFIAELKGENYGDITCETPRDWNDNESR